MNPHDTNGHDPPPENIDTLAVAEDLRASLTDATTKAARLVAALRRSKKETKALSAVLANLKQFNLGTGGVR